MMQEIKVGLSNNIIKVISRYGMNLYRGCTHNCVYCDGRSEGYIIWMENLGKMLQ